jgi:flavin-dependent dehydrogenase
MEAAGLVDDSTGGGIYYADAAGASDAQATYVEV